MTPKGLLAAAFFLWAWAGGLHIFFEESMMNRLVFIFLVASMAGAVLTYATVISYRCRKKLKSYDALFLHYNNWLTDHEQRVDLVRKGVLELEKDVEILEKARLSQQQYTYGAYKMCQDIAAEVRELKKKV